MKSKKLITTLALASIIALCGCNSGGESSFEEDSSTLGYEALTVEKYNNLIHTYNSKSEYNFSLNYGQNIVHDRTFYGSMDTAYNYDGNKISLTYEYNGAYYTDYYNELSDSSFIYYIDTGGTKEYQYVDQNSELYNNFASSIEEVNFIGVDYQKDCLFNLDAKKIIPTPENKNAFAKHILGDRKGEVFEDFVLSYDEEGYITNIDAISIYKEYVYYFTITLTDFGFISLTLPSADHEYVGNVPYYNNEDYTGTSLTTEQGNAIFLCEKASDLNYKIDSTWIYALNGQLYSDYMISTSTIYANDCVSYKYTDATTGVSYNDYIVVDATNPNDRNYSYYTDKGNGTYDKVSLKENNSGFVEAAQNYLLDSLNLANLKAEDFVFNGTYILPKDKETEKALCKQIFGYDDAYYGLHIYLSQDGTSIAKVETSIFVVQENDSYISYQKAYAVSDIGTSTINFPAAICE